MTKEEILEKCRSDNAGKDIEDLEVQKTAATIAYFSSFGLCVLVSILNWIFTRQIKIECWIVFFGMVCVAFFVKFSRLKKLHELFVALGYLLIFAALLVLFILQLSGKLVPLQELLYERKSCSSESLKRNPHREKTVAVRPCADGRSFQKYNQLYRNPAVLSDSKACLNSVRCPR